MGLRWGSGLLRVLVVASAVSQLAGCGAGSGGNGGGGGNPTTVTFTFKGQAPTAVAAQVGLNSFTAATVNSGAVSLSIPEGTTRFALAYACPAQVVTAGGAQIEKTTIESVVEASTVDGTLFSVGCGTISTSGGDTGILTGSVDLSAISGANTLSVAAANATANVQWFSVGGPNNFSLTMPAGTDRVAIGAYVAAASDPYGANTVWTLAAVRNFDGVSVPGAVNGGAAVVLDAGDAVTQQPITYKNVPGNYAAPSTFALYSWKDGGGVSLSNGATNQFPTPPASATEDGDTYSFTASAQSNTRSGEFMYVATSSSTGGPVSFTFPAPWSYAGPAPAALPTFNIDYTGFAGKTGLVDDAFMGWSPQTNSHYFFDIEASGNYMSGSTAMSFPDLSGVPGFLAPPASGTNVIWGADLIQSSRKFLQVSNAPADLVSVENVGIYTVP